MTALSTFIKKTEAATKARSKEMRITLQEAQAIVIEISGMLETENVLLKKIIDLQENNVPVAQANSSDEPMIMDGGSFK